MRTVALSVWPRLFARLWTREWLARKPAQAGDPQHDEMPDHLKRDLGLLDGRDRVGPEMTRQTDELREALRLLPRSL